MQVPSHDLSAYIKVHCIISHYVSLHYITLRGEGAKEKKEQVHVMK